MFYIVLYSQYIVSQMSKLQVQSANTGEARSRQTETEAGFVLPIGDRQCMNIQQHFSATKKRMRLKSKYFENKVKIL